MQVITVNGKEYKIKFGYKAVAASGMISRVMSEIEKLDNTNTDNSADAINAIASLVPVIAEMTLAGLQKFHKDEFEVDYENDSDVKEKLNLIADLLDEYFDPDDGSEPENSMIELFWKFAQELIESGFLSLNRNEMETDVPKIPQDRKKKQAK